MKASEKIHNIAIVGNGNAGYYFHETLEKNGYINLLFARHPQEGEFPLKDLYADPDNFDLIIVCVSDNAIAEICESIPPFHGLLVHVSGATPIDSIPAKHKRRGVLYPLMSLSGKPILPKEIPFCIEAAEDDDLEFLILLVKSLNANWYAFDSEQRAYLHLAAVFAHNFTNHLVHIAQDLVQERHIDFRILLPLIDQACERLHEKPALELQTGPAVRNDKNTINKHLALIKNPEIAEIYKLLSKSINKTHDQKL